LHSLLTKPIVIGVLLVATISGGIFAGLWEYAGSVPESLQVVCNLVGSDASDTNVVGIVGEKNPSYLAVDGVWTFLFEGTNSTGAWSSANTTSFHIPASGTTIIRFQLPGLSQHRYPGTSHGASMRVNVTLFVWKQIFHVGPRTLNYTGVSRNEVVAVPFAVGDIIPC